MFILREIVWAKVKGYPWWPAEISKLPTSDQNFYKVSFLGQNNHAHLEQKAIRKYKQNYSNFKAHKYKGLQNSIQMADAQLQQRNSNIILDKQINSDNLLHSKAKRLIRKNFRKILMNKNTIKSKKRFQMKKLQRKHKIQQNQQIIQKQNQQKQKLEEQMAQQESQKYDQNQEYFQYNSEEVDEIKIQRNVDRKKIQAFQQELMNFIRKFNVNNFQNQKQCFELILKIQKYSFKPQELIQSKITNMITYISSKLNQKTNITFRKQQIEMIDSINNKLKSEVVKYLFNVNYYEHYLNKMRKNIPQDILQNQHKDKKFIKINNMKVKKQH